MTLGVGSLGGYALGVRPELRRLRLTSKDVAGGLASAAALYGIFQAGDRIARRIMSSGAAEIAAIYELRTLAPQPAIAAALALVIGPGEELFWRGIVQHGLQRWLGRWGAAALATTIYGGVHLVSENLTLTGAAATAGAFWGALYASTQRLPPLIVSHVAWDIWIFLVAPTAEAR
jgi:membrane protease YdiL (CAAX protease family)